jgi:hypothetical protein
MSPSTTDRSSFAARARRPLAVIALYSLTTAAAGACAPPPDEIEKAGRAEIEWDPAFLQAKEIVGTVSSYYGYAALVYNWYQWASGESGQAARDLRNELNGIHFDIARIEDKVRELDKFVDRAIVDAKITAIAGPRADVKTALDYQTMPDYRHAAELLAATAANTLLAPSFYEMPTQWNPRFEPRLASVSFVEAVTAWLTLRAANEHPIDGELRTNLGDYANHIEGIATRTRNAVACRRGCDIVTVRDRCIPRPIDPDNPPEPCPTHLVGAGFADCSDGIAGRLDSVPGKPTVCPVYQGEWRESLPDLAQQVVESRYAPQVFEQTAAQWRQLAGL